MTPHCGPACKQPWPRPDLRVGAATTGEHALRELQLNFYEVMLLDMNMPGMGGLATCRAVREQHREISIIVLTVRDAQEDMILAFEAGADDYVTKPFRLPELLARIGAALRRAQRSPEPGSRILCIGPISLDPDRHLVRRGEATLHLTPIEFKLLHALMNAAGKPLTHKTLLTKIWGPEYGEEREYLRVYVNQLRKKIEEDPAHPRYLTTENYLGYRFALPDE